MSAKNIRKRPALTFYPKEWIWDIELRQCSPAARGLWVDLLCIMHEGEPYGHLTAPEDIVLRMVGLESAEYRALLAELEDVKPSGKRVAYRTDEGVLYSKRMVRDEEDRIARKVNGGKGGNPTLVNRGRLSEPEEKGKEVLRTKMEDEFARLYPAHRLDNYGAGCFISADNQDEILARLRVAVKSEDWTRENGRYVPKASKWILDGSPAPATQPSPVSAPASVVSTMDPDTARRIREARRG